MVGEKKLVTFARSTTSDNASPGPVDISLASNTDSPRLYNLVEPELYATIYPYAHTPYASPRPLRHTTPEPSFIPTSTIAESRTHIPPLIATPLEPYPYISVLPRTLDSDGREWHVYVINE